MAKITRRIGRANAACSHKVSVTRDLGGRRGGAGNTHILPITLYDSIRSVGVKNDSTDKNTVVFDRWPPTRHKLAHVEQLLASAIGFR